jgi:hypothetical protein
MRHAVSAEERRRAQPRAMQCSKHVSRIHGCVTSHGHGTLRYSQRLNVTNRTHDPDRPLEGPFARSAGHSPVTQSSASIAATMRTKVRKARYVAADAGMGDAGKNGIGGGEKSRSRVRAPLLGLTMWPPCADSCTRMGSAGGAAERARRGKHRAARAAPWQCPPAWPFMGCCCAAPEPRAGRHRIVDPSLSSSVDAPVRRLPRAISSGLPAPTPAKARFTIFAAGVCEG